MDAVRGLGLGMACVVIAAGLFPWDAAAEGGTPRSYLVVAQGNALPDGLAEKIAAAGGSLVRTIPQIGMAVAESAQTDFAEKAEALGAGIRAVVPDVRVKAIHDAGSPFAVYTEAVGEVPDAYFPVQWNLRTIKAPEAWAAGATGSGARVAVLDTGLFFNPARTPPTHPDIGANANMDLAMSFVPGEDWRNFASDPATFQHGWHGTWVAGIVAALDNPSGPGTLGDFGTMGVAPEAEIVPVKVVRSSDGTGEISWLVEGIVYAADIEADVINLSLGYYVERRGFIDLNETVGDPSDDTNVSARTVAEWMVAVGRATTYAYQKGVTIVAATGNAAWDLDHNKDWVVIPAECPHVIAVAATAPFLWVKDPDADFDAPAHYTNFGQSAIDLAAPGGDALGLDYPGGMDPCGLPPNPNMRAWVCDMVAGPYPGGWVFGAGTSAAAPHVAGVAALIVGLSPTPLSPSRVAAILRRTADELGKPGQDDFYGQGRVNACRAVMAQLAGN